MHRDRILIFRRARFGEKVEGGVDVGRRCFCTLCSLADSAPCDAASSVCSPDSGWSTLSPGVMGDVSSRTLGSQLELYKWKLGVGVEVASVSSAAAPAAAAATAVDDFDQASFAAVGMEASLAGLRARRRCYVRGR